MKNPLKCPDCETYRKIEYGTEIVKGRNNSAIVGISYFMCPKCKLKRTNVDKQTIINNVRKQLEEVGPGVHRLHVKGENTRFSKFDYLNLKYDARDYYAIPGLYREWNDGYLTPVFFKKEVLLQFNHHPDYRVYLSSFSRVDIYKNNDSIMHHGFGLNRNGLIIAWLGDLDRDLKKEELDKLRAYNVESDHDIASDYYKQQIEAEFTAFDNEEKIFLLKKEFDEKMLKLYQLKLFIVDIKDLKAEYVFPILDDRKQIFIAYSDLNKFLIENIDKKNIREILRQKSITINEDAGSIKHLERLIATHLSKENVSELMCPFYVLYDLRQLADHLSDKNFITEYATCMTRLKLTPGATYFEVYKRLIEKLILSFETINNAIDT